jgi:hypothetical protein
VLGALLCLDRKQRVAFILGVIFNVSSEQGSELMEISRESFRKTVSRGRNKLYHFMSQKCGLIHDDAPCKCHNKVCEFIEKGWLRSDNIKYYKEQTSKVNELITEKMDRFGETVYADFVTLYQSHPFYDPPNQTQWLKEALERPELKDVFDLN